MADGRTDRRRTHLKIRKLFCMIRGAGNWALGMYILAQYLNAIGFFVPELQVIKLTNDDGYSNMSVVWLVGWLIGRSVGNAFVLRFPGSFCITAPAQSHATDSAVYMALFKIHPLLVLFLLLV